MDPDNIVTAINELKEYVALHACVMALGFFVMIIVLAGRDK